MLFVHLLLCPCCFSRVPQRAPWKWVQMMAFPELLSLIAGKSFAKNRSERCGVVEVGSRPLGDCFHDNTRDAEDVGSSIDGMSRRNLQCAENDFISQISPTVQVDVEITIEPKRRHHKGHSLLIVNLHAFLLIPSFIRLPGHPLCYSRGICCLVCTQPDSMHQDTKVNGLVTTITSTQLERMLARVSGLQDCCCPSTTPTSLTSDCPWPQQAADEQESTYREDERLSLKQLSEERASKWPNTLQVCC